MKANPFNERLTRKRFRFLTKGNNANPVLGLLALFPASPSFLSVCDQELGSQGDRGCGQGPSTVCDKKLGMRQTFITAMRCHSEGDCHHVFLPHWESLSPKEITGKDVRIARPAPVFDRIQHTVSDQNLEVLKAWKRGYCQNLY